VLVLVLETGSDRDPGWQLSDPGDALDRGPVSVELVVIE
jgi:hypothetical protein